MKEDDADASFFLLKYHAFARKAKFNTTTVQVLEIYTFIYIHTNTHTLSTKVQKKELDVHSVQTKGHFIFNISVILVSKSKSRTVMF